MVSGRASWDELSGFVVVFEEESVLAPIDSYLVERHGWPIASPEAYPAVMRLRPGYEPGSPTADELELLAVYLHCLPDFVKGNAETQGVSTIGTRTTKGSAVGVGVAPAT